MKDQPINEQESLRIIHAMINKTQGRVSDNGFYFLLWGWLVFVAAISQYTLLKIYHSEMNGLPWAILMPLGGLVSGIRGWRDGKKERVKTYTGEMLGYSGIAFGAGLAIVLVFMSVNGGWLLAYPMIMMVYGMWLFVSGGALKFKPLMIGAVIDWLCSIGSFYVKTEEIILVLAFAVLAGYIIPGHLLNLKYKRENQ